MRYLIRLAQTHASFRLPEVRALAALAGIAGFEVEGYDDEVRRSAALLPDRFSFFPYLLPP